MIVALYVHISEIMTSLSRIIAVPAEAIALAGDGNAALFLAQVLFWWKASGRKKFYKFNSPCTHNLYRVGDSWAEELQLKRTMLATARRRVATKVRISSATEIQAAFEEGALVVYGTDEHHLTWYLVNEQSLAVQCPPLYARLLGSDTIRTGATPHQPAPAKPQVSVQPVSAASPIASTSTSPERTPTLPEVVLLHSPMSEPCIGFNTEKLTETASELTTEMNLQKTSTSPIPLPTLTMRAGEGGEVQSNFRAIAKNIYTELQNRGVQGDPARLIALRAARSGWSVEKTLDVFEAHLLDAERAGARSPVGVAVSRMLDGDAITPAPYWAIAQVQRRKQERKWDERRQVLGVAVQLDDALPERADPLEEQSPLKTLWARVLSDIKLQVTRATFEQRFRNTWLEQRDGVYVVCAKDSNTVEWLAHRLNRLVAQSLQRWGIAELSIGFSVDGPTTLPTRG